MLELRKGKYLENYKECLAINIYRLSMLLGKSSMLHKIEWLEKFIELN
jgi:hypothetical protein